MSRNAVVRCALTGLAVVLLGAAVVSAATQPRRPQDEAVAKGPRPYTDQEVTYTSDHGSIKLAGTLSVPVGKGPFPAVLLVAASVRKIDEKIFNTVAQTPDDATAHARVAAVIDAALASKVITGDQAKETRQVLKVEFMRTELNDKPIEYLKKVRGPVLALVGTLDKIVPADPYVKVMQPVIDTIPGSKLQVLPNLNHVMQTAQTGSPREFGTLEETISPVALKTIGNWIAQQVKRP